MLRGYGKDPYGLSPFGAIGDVSLGTAYPVGTHVVRVELTAPARNLSAWKVGDVQCPLTWELTETTPTARFPGGRPIQVAGVQEVQPPLVWDLHTLTALGPPSNLHRLRSTTLVNAAGVRLVAPSFIDFHGCVATNPKAPARRLIIVDIANDRLAGQGQAWQYNASGTYRLHAGPPSLRKRIYRILTTVPGTWDNDPNFGVGIQPKALVPDGDLPALALRIEEQVSRDPEVVSVRCSLTLTQEQILFINLVVQGKFYQDAQQISFQADSENGLVEIGRGA